MIGTWEKESLVNVPVSLAKNILPKLAIKATSSALDEFEWKISRQGAIRAAKWFTLLVSNKDMDDIIRIVRLLENSGLLIHGATETVKYERTKQEGGVIPALIALMTAALITPMASSLIQPAASSFKKCIFGKGVTETLGGFLSLLVAPSLLKCIFEKGIMRAGRWF